MLVSRTSLFSVSILFFLGCAGQKPSLSGREPAPGAETLGEEAMLFAEVTEFINLGIENYRDSLWFEAGENFDSALVHLALLGENDSLNPDIFPAIKRYQDSIYKLLTYSIAKSSMTQENIPWKSLLDIEIEEMADPAEPIIDSLSQAIKPGSYDLPLPNPLNQQVLQAIAVFSGSGRGYFTKWLNRRSRYQSMIHRKLEEKGMPRDLLYLSMIESGFNPKAWSTAQASGIWQFISGTGRRYGLKDDWWIDPRRDPVKATDAALGYLGDLYAEFGDWYLAMAAYNCGEGRVRRWLAKDPTMTYWDMPLPKETRYYVPKILAAMIIGHNPEQYGFLIENPEPEMVYDTATVQHCISLATIAKTAEATEEEIVTLNPELRRWCSPPNRASHVIYLPAGKREVFASNYALLDKTKLVNWQHHVVRRGETLSGISSKYSISVVAIKSANRLKGNRVKAGTSLLIPIPPGGHIPSDVLVQNGKTAAGKKSGSTVTYTVRKGDNLFDISRRLGTTVAQLRVQNKLASRSIIRPGQKLKFNKSFNYNEKADENIRVRDDFQSELVANAQVENSANPRPTENSGEQKTHQVIAGETLYSISQKLGVTADKLKEWNGLKGNTILAGQKLKYSSLPPSKSSSYAGTSTTHVHHVKPGETIYQIAKDYDTTQQAIMELNGITSPSTILAGDSLIVAMNGNQQGSSNSSGKRFYVVKPGDSLWDISVRFRSSVEKLKDLNRKLSPVLKPGTRIRVE